MTSPRPSAEFPAVDPTHDLPAAAELIRRIAAEQHPYDAVLLGMAADVLADRVERDDERRGDLGNALGWELDEAPSWVDIMRGIADLRDLATPGEIEAKRLVCKLCGYDDPTLAEAWGACLGGCDELLAATPPAQGEAEAFAFLDGMYAIREDDVDPDYAARKWAQRGHVAPDEEDRAIVARMLGRAALAPTAPRVEDDRGVDRGDPARYWSKKTEGETAGGER